jgi:hypothetical protein
VNWLPKYGNKTVHGCQKKQDKKQGGDLAGQVSKGGRPVEVHG